MCVWFDSRAWIVKTRRHWTGWRGRAPAHRPLAGPM